MVHVEDPDVANSNGLQIVSLIDLTARRLKTIQRRAEAKDYVDLAAAPNEGIGLAQALGTARAVYGDIFNPVAALKALTYFEDGNLPRLPQDIKEHLRTIAQSTSFESIPQVMPKPGIVR